MTAIAFFDVDETLVDGYSGLYASLRLVRHGILKKRRLPQALYYRLANCIVPQDVRRIYEIAAADMAGTSLKRVLEIGRDCLERDIRPRLFSQGIHLIRQHQSRGDRVILITSSPTMIIEPLRAHLGVDEAYSSGPVIEDGILQRRLRLPLCFGAGKLHYAQEAASRLQIPLRLCTFYSNDIHDLPLLERVGRPTAVNPDRKLKKIAERRGWPILSFKS